MIRESLPDDLTFLRRIQRRSLPEPNPELLDYAVGHGSTSNRPQAGDGLSHGPLVLVSVADGEPVGYVLAIRGGDGAYVAELAVASGRRREGRGRLLLSTALDRLAREGRSSVSLTVQPPNAAARALYGELGFEETARLENYYGEGKPAIEMSRELS